MRWKILGKQQKIVSIEKIVDAILKNRGIKTVASRKEFLNPVSLETYDSSALGVDSDELKKSLRIVKTAIEEGNKIIVYGDYDADGICATAIMWETLEALGAKVMPFVPKREEGYGLKIKRLDQFASEGVNLIITVDQGIVQNTQVKHAKKIGLKIIITDHHTLGKSKPRADAVIHTTEIAGCAIAWFVARYWAKHIKNIKAIPDSLDLATIGSVTDMVPLLGASRSLVKLGLPQVVKTKREGLKQLIQLAGLAKETFSTYEIGFVIGPRLNATGRVDDPMDTLRLLCTKDSQRAKLLAEKLNVQNSQRQTLTEQISLKAKEKWLKEDGESPLIFVYDDSFHEGVIGLAASRMVELFYRPAIVLAKGEEFSKASARSIEGFNIIEVIRSCSQLLEGHGGHKMAAGFTVKTDKLEILKSKLVETACKQLNPDLLTKQLKIDLELPLAALTWELWENLRQLQPFGQGNPEPVFVSRQVRIDDLQLIGAAKNHLKLKISDEMGKTKLRAIAFNLAHFFSLLNIGIKVDLAYNLIVDDWLGGRVVQLKVRDIKINED